MPRTARRLALLLALVTLAAPATPASAWSFKEHVQFTRLAARRLLADPATPPAMKTWLADITPGLDPDDPGDGMDAERAYFMGANVGIDPQGLDGLLAYAIRPDQDVARLPKDSTVAPFGAHERKMHYVDMELFLPPGESNAYRPDGSAKPPAEAFPRDPADPRYAQAGLLPFRAEQCYDNLVAAIRAGRLADPAGLDPADSDTAEKWAGFLAHYAQDNTQPQHATVDYKSASYFGNRRDAPNVHSEVEYRMVDDKDEPFADLRGEFWPKFVAALGEVADPSATDDVWRSTLEVSRYSYDALPLIGEAAAAATPADGPLDTRAFFRHAGTLRGEPTTVMDMKARQTALAVVRTQKLLRQAWREATGE